MLDHATDREIHVSEKPNFPPRRRRCNQEVTKCTIILSLSQFDHDASFKEELSRI
jgi:hypothetical protein